MGLTNLYFICGQIVLLTWLTHIQTQTGRQQAHRQPHTRTTAQQTSNYVIPTGSRFLLKRDCGEQREEREWERGDSPLEHCERQREREREHTSRLSTGGDVAVFIFFFSIFPLGLVNICWPALLPPRPPPVPLTTSTPATPLAKPSAPRPPTLRH